MNYSLSQKPVQPSHPENGKAWYATPQSIGVLDKEKFINRICQENPSLKAQLSADLVLIIHHLRECLRSGYNVNLAGLGEFYVKFDCEPLVEESAKGYNPSRQIKEVKAAWKPSKEMKSLTTSHGSKNKITFKEVPTRKVERVVRAATKAALPSIDIPN